jgi:hypothetical protein
MLQVLLVPDIRSQLELSRMLSLLIGSVLKLRRKLMVPNSNRRRAGNWSLRRQLRKLGLPQLKMIALLQKEMMMRMHLHLLCRRGYHHGRVVKILYIVLRHMRRTGV